MNWCPPTGKWKKKPKIITAMIWSHNKQTYRQYTEDKWTTKHRDTDSKPKRLLNKPNICHAEYLIKWVDQVGNVFTDTLKLRED